MTKKNEWFVYLEDRDKKQYALAGPIAANLVDDWIDVVVDAQETGRNIICYEVTHDSVSECRYQARNKNLTEVESSELVPSPIDRSNYYLGTLPTYASSADRGKLVQILCKGKCRAGRWATLNKAYPGRELLRQAAFNEYTATCLRCGVIAKDNYNWYR